MATDKEILEASSKNAQYILELEAINMDENIKNLIGSWKEEFNQIKEQLIIRGGEASAAEYSLLSCEALRLMTCINDLSELMWNEE